MRIGLIFDGMSLPPKDGVTNRAYNISKYLQKLLGDDVFLYLGDRGWCTEAELEKEALLNIRLFPAEWLYDFAQLPRVSELISKDKIDVLHVLNSHTVVLNFGKFLSNKLNVPLICDMHDVESDLFRTLNKPDSEIEQAKLLQKIVADSCDKVVFMSPADYSSLRSIGISEEKLVNIPNGTDIQILKEYNQKQKNVIFLGNLFYEPNMNAANFIYEHIAKKAHDIDPEINFIVIGRKPDDLVSALPYFNYVGPIDDIGSYMKNALVGLAPVFQGSGMKVKILTYSSFGLPIIATPKALEGYSGDYVIQADTAENFIENIIQLSKDTTYAEFHGKGLHDWVSEEYKWDKMVEKLVEVYQHIKQDKVKPNKEGVIADINAFSVSKISLPFWLSEKRFISKDLN